jgi:lectin-like protein
LLCIMSNASGRELRTKFRSLGFPIDDDLYARLNPVFAKDMANLPAVGINGAYRCPVDGRYYLLIPYQTTWAEAESTARRMGGHLATIRSPEQEMWLSNKWANDGWLWVGYTRNEGDASWRWITGETPPPPIWEPERPETDPAKTRGVLIYHEDARGIWSGLANRPPNEHLFGLIELDKPPAVDVDSLP